MRETPRWPGHQAVRLRSDQLRNCFLLTYHRPGLAAVRARPNLIVRGFDLDAQTAGNDIHDCSRGIAQSDAFPGQAAVARVDEGSMAASGPHIGTAGAHAREFKTAAGSR